jgi:HEAT repeat protein
VEVIGKLVTRDDLPLITGMLKDNDSDVRRAAVEALARVATDVDAEGLLDLLAERSQGWDSIAGGSPLRGPLPLGIVSVSAYASAPNPPEADRHR